MAQPIVLPPGVALSIIAFLLSLLPAGFFIWLWYLRKHDRTIPAKMIALAFAIGAVLVVPAFWFEDLSSQLWRIVSPETAHYFAGAVLPLQGWQDILLPAIGTFLVVATVEEGLRFVVMRIWFKRSKVIDQVFDGLLVGVAVGLGFATLENTLYFLQLFEQGNYDTLVFVFFLRFMISTLAHISFAGIMGTMIARGVFDLYAPRKYIIPAFFIPWLLHGLYDLLLGINQSLYAVFILLPPLLVLVYWTGRREFFIIHRKGGKLLAAAQAPNTDEMEAVNEVMETMDSPWNVNAPWLSKQSTYRKILEKLHNDET